MRDLFELNIYRRIDWELRAHGVVGDRFGGCFEVPVGQMLLHVIAASGGNWDHVSVSLAQRTPTWEEMSAVHRMFAKSTEVWMQLHVTPSAHINVHPYCLHLWRPHHRDIPTPPALFVA